MDYIRIILLCLAFLFIYKLYETNKKHYIFEAFSSKASSNEWLYTTILDYYLQTIAFSVIVAYTEKPINAFLWITSNCLLGSPVAIFYLLSKKNWSLKN